MNFEASLKIQCPRCGVALPDVRGTVVLACACSRYPQVEGVPVVVTAEYASDELEAAVKAIEARSKSGAVEWIRYWSDSNQRSLNALLEVITDDSFQGNFIEDWQRHGKVGREDYFILRWACPSFLCNMALLPVLAGRHVLDLGCGVGHLAHQATSLSRPPYLVAADGILIHSLALRKYFAPGTPCVCIDL